MIRIGLLSQGRQLGRAFVQQPVARAFAGAGTNRKDVLDSLLQGGDKAGSSSKVADTARGKVSEDPLASLKKRVSGKTPALGAKSGKTETLQDLLQKFNKDGSGGKGGDKNANNNNNGKKKGGANNSNSNSNSKKGQDSSGTTTSNSQEAGGSIRDSFKRTAQAKRRGGPGGRGGGDREGMNSTGTRAASADILSNLKSTLPPASTPSGPSLEEVQMEELTEGEMRYRQHQQRMKKEQERFQSSFPPSTQRGDFGTSYRGGRNNGQPQQGGGDRGVAPGWGPGSGASSSGGGGGSQRPQQQRSNYNQRGRGPASQQELDIAELKRRTYERLNQGKLWAKSHKQQHGSAAPLPKKATDTTVVKAVSVPAKGLELRELASRLSMRLPEVAQRLADLGVEATGAASVVDPDVAELLVLEIGLECVREEDPNATLSYRSRDQTRLKGGEGEEAAVALAVHPRAPIVCIMGHVDHGKTTLLDSLRKANVAGGEAGGITQKLSAFRVALSADSVYTGGGQTKGGKPTQDKKKAKKGSKASLGEDPNSRTVVFLDTPGHAAFSTMRTHGASATDLVVLVVAIDDGVKQQTCEALQAAKAAGCQIVVALNKADKIPEGKERQAARARVLSQLVENDLICEDFGGDVMVVETAAATGEGLKELVEALTLQADMLELKAAVEGQAEATVLDANMEKGRGVVADVLVRWGCLKVGDPIVVDTMFGRVKAMTDDRGKRVMEAGPAVPVRLLGLRSVPTAGQELLSVPSEARAREISERRTRLAELRQRNARGQGGDGSGGGSDKAQVSLVLKADGVGTLDALAKVVTELGKRTDDVVLKIVEQSVGDITRSDVEHAGTSGAAVFGFNVGLADSATRAVAKELDVAVNRDTIIYRLEEALVDQMERALPRERVESLLGSARVQQVFQLRDKKGTEVAGCIVDSGRMRASPDGKGGLPLMFKITRASAAAAYAKEQRQRQQDGESLNSQEEEKTEAEIALLEAGIVFEEMEISAETCELKRFKDVVSSVEQGNECGLVLQRFKGWQDGDVVECYSVEHKQKKLDLIKKE